MKSYRTSARKLLSIFLITVAALMTGMLFAVEIGAPVDSYKPPTEVSGTISEDVVWTQAGSPYLVRSTITIPAGVKVTVEPGVRINFVQNQGIIVRGVFEAVGQGDSPIVFTGTAELPGWWRSINIQQDGSAALEWCEVSFAGASDRAAILKAGSGSLELSNSTIRRTDGDGLRIVTGYSAFESNNNVYLYNTNGVRVGINASFVDLMATFVGNVTDIHLDGGTINTSVKWGVGSDYSLVITGNITVAEGASLEISPGSVVKFGQNTGLWIRGHLEASGNEYEQIYFTDLRDQMVGGDSSGDDSAPPSPGWWRSLNVQHAGSAVIEWCVISYAGRSDGAALLKSGSGFLRLADSIVQHTAGDGLRIAAGYSSFEHERNAYINNTNGVRVGINASFSDLTSTFELNDLDIQLDSGTINTAVEWGAPSNYSMVVAGNITVAAGASLEIVPGTVIKFRQNQRLAVSGHFEARGEEGRQIHFTDVRDHSVGGDALRDDDATSPEAGWWRSIMLQHGGSATLDWCVIGYAGLGDTGGIVKGSTGPLYISNTAIHSTTGDGIRVDNAAGGVTIRHSLIEQNTGAGLYYRSDGVLIESSTFRSNDIGIRLTANASLVIDEATALVSNNTDVHIDGGTISGDIVWQAPGDISIFLSSYTAIARNARLRVKPGTVIKIAENTQIRVDGILIAEGTEEDPVYFTDLRDDSVGGDTNRDNDETLPEPGWWRSINIFNEGSAIFEWCEIRYAGRSDGAAVLKSGSGYLRLVNSTIGFTAGDGLRVSSGYSGFENENNTFNYNTNGIRVGINVSFYDLGTTFEGNVTDIHLDGGTINTHVRWGAGSDYSMVVTSDISIAEGASLEILPGTVIKISQFRRITVLGQLNARGEETLPIRFTDARDDSVGSVVGDGGSEPEPGWWRSIYIQNQGSAVLEWCVISYAGRTDGAAIVKTGAGALRLANSMIYSNDGDGLRIIGGYSSFEHESNAYINNSIGVRVGINVSFADLTTVFANNGLDIRLEGGTINTSVRWGASSEYSMTLVGDVTVAKGAMLEILPGTVIKLERHRRIVVSGHLSAEGEEDEQIYFTDLRDKSVGSPSVEGDAEPEAGWWRSIMIQEEGTAEFMWCNIMYAGFGDMAGILKTGSGRLSLGDSLIRSTLGDGLNIRNNTGAVEIARVTFAENVNGAAVTQQNTPLTFEDCVFQDNTEYGLRNDGPAEVVATECWWGDITGPHHALLNRRGQGNTVSDRVVFDPWIGKDELDWEEDIPEVDEEYEYDTVVELPRDWLLITVEDYCLVIPQRWNDLTREDREYTQGSDPEIEVLGTWSAGRYFDEKTTAAVYRVPFYFIEELLEDFMSEPEIYLVRRSETTLVNQQAESYIFEMPRYFRAHFTFSVFPDDTGKHLMLLSMIPFEALPAGEAIVQKIFSSFSLCDDPSDEVIKYGEFLEPPVDWFWVFADGVCLEIPGDWYDNTEEAQYDVRHDPDVEIIGSWGDDEYGYEEIQFVIARVALEALEMEKEDVKQELTVLEETEGLIAGKAAYWLVVTEPEYGFDRIFFAHQYDTDKDGFALSFGFIVGTGFWDKAEPIFERIMESLSYCGDLIEPPADWVEITADGLCLEIPANWFDNTEEARYDVRYEPDVEVVGSWGDDEYGYEQTLFIIWLVTPEELDATAKEIKEDMEILEETDGTVAGKPAYWLVLTEPEYGIDRLIFAYQFETDEDGFALTIGFFVEVGLWHEAEEIFERIMESLRYCEN